MSKEVANVIETALRTGGNTYTSPLDRITNAIRSCGTAVAKAHAEGMKQIADAIRESKPCDT